MQMFHTNIKYHERNHQIPWTICLADYTEVELPQGRIKTPTCQVKEVKHMEKCYLLSPKF